LDPGPVGRFSVSPARFIHLTDFAASPPHGKQKTPSKPGVWCLPIRRSRYARFAGGARTVIRSSPRAKFAGPLGRAGWLVKVRFTSDPGGLSPSRGCHFSGRAWTWLSFCHPRAAVFWSSACDRPRRASRGLRASDTAAYACHGRSDHARQKFLFIGGFGQVSVWYAERRTRSPVRTGRIIHPLG